MDNHRDEAAAAAVSVPTEIHAVDDVTPVASPPPQQPLDAEERAARLIQRVYRGYRTRRELKGCGLDATTRWREVMQEAKWRQMNRPCAPSDVADEEDSDSDDASPRQARQNWKRVVNIAKRAGGDDDVVSQETSPDRRGSGYHPLSPASTRTTTAESPKRHSPRHSALFGDVDIPANEMAKVMDLQYFLEMVDLKHRYGSNLRNYHTYWKNTPSKQNFFYWLDYGEGKDVDLPRCPRERLNREQVRYLTREERMHYLVTVDEAGRFRWAKNGERVWTDNSRFKDSLKGVVPKDEPAPRFLRHTSDGVPIVQAGESSEEEDDSEDEESSSSDDEEVKRYVNSDFDEAKGVKKLTYVRPAVVFNHLMRQSLKKEDMWIFVADTSYRIYIGIKESGAFQHSSFLRGARIAAAGLIKIRDGQLRSLSPMSGHYRPPPRNFRAFVHALEDQGVDMSHVSISKSYAVLVGIEGYKRIKKKKRALRERLDTRKQKMQSQHDTAKSEAKELGASIVAEKKKDETGQHAEMSSTEPCPETDAETAAASAAPPDFETIPRSSDLSITGEKPSHPEDKRSPADDFKGQKPGGTIWTSLRKLAHRGKPKVETATDTTGTPPSIDAGVTKVERRHERTS